MMIEVVHAEAHKPEEYRNVLEGRRALKLLDDQGKERGELVWRLAHGHSVEIAEFGIYAPSDRRKGFGSLLLKHGISDMRSFFGSRGLAFRRIYLFCEAWNEPARGFYEANGFVKQAVLKGFYADRRGMHDSVMYVRDMECEPGSS